MAGILSPEQEQQMAQMFQTQGGGPGGELSPEAAQAAMEQGAQAAQAEAEGGTPDGAATGAPPQAAAPAAPAAPEQPAADPNAAALASIGFQSVEDLIAAFQEQAESGSQMRSEMDQLLGFQQAIANANMLDDGNPNKKAILEILGPVAEEVQNQARNRAIAAQWNMDAQGLEDFELLRPEIDAYIQSNPALAMDPRGLSQAYNGVRSKKWMPEDKMLADPKNVERLADNPAVKDAVIKKYLADLHRNGEIPPSIGPGGGTPLTGDKSQPTTLEEASKRARALMGA